MLYLLSSASDACFINIQCSLVYSLMSTLLSPLYLKNKECISKEKSKLMHHSVSKSSSPSVVGGGGSIFEGGLQFYGLA